MALPQLTAADVEAIVPNCKVVAPSLGGGQKIVYPCCIDGHRCAVKFILLGELKDDLDGDVQSKIDTVRARVEREIAIMRKINSPNIVRMGDLELTPVTFHEQSLLYYSEEWVEGESLSTILRDSKLPVCEALKLCTDITQAIYELWSLNKVHRDIKPQNIMRQHSDGTYILLDLGLALDLEDKSLTQYGYVPGTKTYFSPEQLDINHKRDTIPPDSLVRTFQFQLIYTLMPKVYLQLSNSYVSQITFLHPSYLMISMEEKVRQ